MRFPYLIALLLVFAGCAATPKAQPTSVIEHPPAPVAPAERVAVPPKVPANSGVNEANLDRSINPCDDFYQFACGGWMKRNEIPPDRARWGSFSEIDERNVALLNKTLEADAAGHGDAQDLYAKKLGDLYASCMDEAKIESTAPSDLKAELARIDAVKSQAELVAEVARMHLAVGNPMFVFSSGQDYKNATEVIGLLDQAGIGMPDRDYYLKDEGKFKEIREKYQLHVQKMFQLSGVSEAAAIAHAKTVMRIERALAEGQLSRVERRDPANVYHRIDLAGIEKAAPHFPWTKYLKDIGQPGVKAINVAVPGFFAALDKLLVEVKLPDWKVYLAWQLIHGAAPFLSKPFVDENFHFDALLSGSTELPPRWKRCVHSADQALGEALGQSFVRQTFGAEGKRSTQEMVAAIEEAMHSDLKTLSWMDDPTRAEAQAKLKAIANKIGYPDKWRNYDTVEISRDSYFRSMMNASAFETHRQLEKIGKPLDRGEWEMTPPTVNAYYEPSMNEMVFPAGILQPPFFSSAARAGVNYGAIGMVMGHELTHGFDDEGRKFDGQGNLRQWWTPKVNDEFERRAQCVVKQFDGYVAVDDLHLKGALTLGENLADLGGIKLAFHAWMAERAAGRSGPPAQATPGQFSDEQLFFLGTAQAWCSKTRPENARMRVTVDPHSPPEYRVNGPLANLSEFAEAFQCKAPSKMVRAEQCVVW